MNPIAGAKVGAVIGATAGIVTSVIFLDSSWMIPLAMLGSASFGVWGWLIFRF